MGLYIGLDVGTTTLSAVLLDSRTGELAVTLTLPHDADVTTPRNRACGHAELDLGKVQELATHALAQVVARSRRGAQEISGLGITGQMHGLGFLDAHGCPRGPAITWQDQRATEVIPGTAETYLERFLSQAGGPSAFHNMGCQPATGYFGPTLYWLKLNERLPQVQAIACLIPDAVVAHLTGLSPCTDPTDGGSTGLFDIVGRRWDEALIQRLDFPLALFPRICRTGDVAGALRSDLAQITGLRPGTPVMVALGDNQASYLGSTRDPAGSLLINVGTGSQISGLMDRFQRVPGLDTRAYLGESYLLVGAALYGGTCYAMLRDFFQQVPFLVGPDRSVPGPRATPGRTGDQSLDGERLSQEALYETMNALAAAAPPGADGVRCVPTFAGTRADPTARGAFTGLTPQNLTPGHLVRALLEGMAEGFQEFYVQMLPHMGEKGTLVGSGNALRRNTLFSRILAERLELPLHIPAHREEAAMGAALLAAVGTGELPSLAAASDLIRYSAAS
jgi:sugar (pentulose or hexulose) kinase